MAHSIVKGIEIPALAPVQTDRHVVLGERLDLVDHVNVRLTISLGSAEMSIGKLFALATGDVVPLDREVDAPVDVRLHGRLVARGVLVAVGDRFGVRVTEILSGPA
jgi:flagellar motor switch protein FliN/FliY